MENASEKKIDELKQLVIKLHMKNKKLHRKNRRYSRRIRRLQSFIKYANDCGMLRSETL